MQIEDRFTVSLPVDEAWKVLLDIERIAPCMPGAELKEIDGDEYHGIVKVKLGAITAQFKGVARFVEVDEAARRVVLRAEGKEMRGQGNAAATVTATLAETEEGTEVHIDTDMAITGKMAQFGRGVMADVSSKLLGEFARCLEEDLLGGGDSGTADDTAPAAGAAAMAQPPAATAADASGTGAGGTGGTSQRRTIQGPSAAPVDLLAVAGGSVAERAIPAGIGVVLLLLVLSRRMPRRAVLAAVGAALVAALVAQRESS